jgi:ATPase subunit of ABC transporter with duplicated ATPase domains
VIEFKNVSKAYGDRLLIDNVNFKIPAGAIVGIIGPNGAGKSTLFRMLTGKEQPDSGEIVKGRRSSSRTWIKAATRSRQDRVRRDFRRRGRADGGQVRNAVACVYRPLQLQGRRSAEDRRRAFRAANAAVCIWPRR